MKAEVDGVPKNPQKPMEQFSVEEVQNWFKTFKGGKYADFAKNFAGVDGDEMVKLSEQQTKEIAKDVANGIAIYNQWHQKVTGIFFPHLCRFLFCLLFSCFV